jgi:spermidine synthase
VGRKEWAGALVAPVVTVEDGRTLLRVGGVIQSVAVDEWYEPDIWDAMVPDRRPQSVLVLGMGGGTIASLIHRRFGPVPVVGVEFDQRIVHLAHEHFGIAQLPQVQIIAADAFQFVPQCQVTFSLICVDLYVAGHLEHGVLGTTFLCHIARLLEPDGVVVFNLWSSPYLKDQLHRLERVFQVFDVREVGENVIVRCRARPFVAVVSFTHHPER